MTVLRLTALPVTTALVTFGVWVTGGWLSDDLRVSMGLTAAWLAIAAAGCAWVAWRVRPLRVPVLLGYALSAAAIGIFLGLTTLRDRVVDEQVVAGAPATAAPARARAVELLRARFRSHEHQTTGTAAVVRLADGRRFATLTGFATSPGPDLRVRLVPGNSAAGGAPGNVDLGPLKGNRGDQQYAIPTGVHVAGRTLVIWCRAFSAPFGSARLSSEIL